ncbi:MAG TPA: TonB family protein [Vicinamibacterales bacterium]
MNEAVSDILLDRARTAEGMSRMLVVSLVAHAVLIGGIALAPESWRSPSVKPEATPMMITLGGAPGPQAGGMTSIADRATQAVAEPAAKPKVEPPPAAKPPEMVAPEPSAKVVPKTPPKPIEKPADKSASKTPTTGTEIKSGSSNVKTGGAAVPFGGLSTGGGGTGGARVDVANFCCPAYLTQMVQMIQANWNRNQGAKGSVQMKFTIARDGSISNVEVEKPSNIAMLDLESQRALLKTRQLPPLPREFDQSTLTVHLIFEY